MQTGLSFRSVGSAMSIYIRIQFPESFRKYSGRRYGKGIMEIERTSADGTDGLIYRVTVNFAPHGRKVIYHNPISLKF